ncbi:biotin synthase BioB [Rhodothalassium salexigens]|nr:biotin synthase BioB [Rhodothalassium salexigens]
MPMDDQTPPALLRHDWTRADIAALLDLPFNELVFRAASVHRAHHDPNKVQLSQLLSIKTGGCKEDCGYCPQSAHHNTGVKAEKLMPVDEIVAAAKRAKENGATRYCMGAAWREPKDRDVEHLCRVVEAVRDLGMETCMTLGMLTQAQADRLAQAGLDYYNHNLDSAPDFYGEIISTRTYQERLDTLDAVREAGMAVCSGGIVGMGESRDHRAGLLEQLAARDPHPESVPINMLVQVEGTPLAGTEALDPFEFVRTIAAARITMPRSAVRLSAGRETMSDELQALCFLAGANSIFYGDKLLTTDNPEGNKDMALLDRLGITPG